MNLFRSICFANSNIPWGGGEKWHYDAALAFLKKGWRVSALCHPAGELYKRFVDQPNINILPLPLSNTSFLNPFVHRTIKNFLVHQQVDSVIMNLPADLKCVAPAANRAGVRHIFYRRGSALPVQASRTNKILFRMLTGVIANSLETKRLITTTPSLIAPEKIHVLPNGIDITRFDADYTAAALPPYPGIVLGNAGRLNKQKGQHLLLYLAKELQNLVCPFSLLIAGTGEREQELRTLAKHLGVTQHVHFIGFQENLASFWKAIDIFVLSSLWEGFGFVLAEAMLARKPLLAFAVSNIPELVHEGENGFLFPLPEHADNPLSTPDLTALAKAVEKLAASPELREQMGKNGRSFATEHFSQDQCMDALEALLTTP